MIQKVGTVSIFVKDQDRAKKFYTDILGFELRSDVPLHEDTDARWLSVAPKSARTEIVLYLIDENWEHYENVVGKAQALTLNVSDMGSVYEDLKSKGVEFEQEPDQQPWGTYAIIVDSEGNKLILIELPKG